MPWIKHLGGVEGASNKGTGSHSFEPHLLSYSFILFKLLRRDISHHWQSIYTGLKVLTDR